MHHEKISGNIYSGTVKSEVLTAKDKSMWHYLLTAEEWI